MDNETQKKLTDYGFAFERNAKTGEIKFEEEEPDFSSSIKIDSVDGYTTHYIVSVTDLWGNNTPYAKREMANLYVDACKKVAEENGVTYYTLKGVIGTLYVAFEWDSQNVLRIH